jgi:hypothetical protein
MCPHLGDRNGSNSDIGRNPAVPLQIADATNRLSDVRFGSKADICAATSHVRFAPNSDRESGHVPNVMSALPPETFAPPSPSAGRFACVVHVLQQESYFLLHRTYNSDFGELHSVYSVTSSALQNSDCGTVRPNALTVLRLITNSNLVGCSTGNYVDEILKGG